MTTAVSSDWLLGTTKGPPESPAHVPFPSDPPAQSLVEDWHWNKDNATYLKLCEIGPASTMRQLKEWLVQFIYFFLVYRTRSWHSNPKLQFGPSISPKSNHIIMHQNLI